MDATRRQIGNRGDGLTDATGRRGPTNQRRAAPVRRERRPAAPALRRPRGGRDSSPTSLLVVSVCITTGSSRELSYVLPGPTCERHDERANVPAQARRARHHPRTKNGDAGS
jgi:hypothetical protein